MKSRVSIILALLVVFSVGLAEPLHASELDWVRTGQLAVDGKGRTSSSDTGPGDTGETQGDPDGWLGGQNLRPTPPVVSDLESDDGDSPEMTAMQNLYFWFLVFLGLR